HADELMADGYDAFSDYAGAYGGAMVTFGNGPSFASAADASLSVWESAFEPKDLDFVPPMSNGNYTWPRAEGDTQWIVEEHLPGDMKAWVKATMQYTVENQDDCAAQVVFSYSWNEHSEGGGICPTMGESPDYIPVTATLDEFGEGLSEYEAENTPYPAQVVMRVNKTGRTLVEFPVSDLNDISYGNYLYVELLVFHDDTNTSVLMTEVDKIDFEGQGNMVIILKAGGDSVSFPIENIDSMCFETPQSIPDPQELILKGDFNYFDAININFTGEPNDFDWRGSHNGAEPNGSDWKSMNAGGGNQRAAFCKEHVDNQFLASNKISLGEGETYRLIFRHRQHPNAATTEGVGLNVFLSSTQDKVNLTDTVRTITSFSLTNFVFDTTDFQALAGGDYYLVFSTLAPADSADVKINVDDVSLKQVLPLNKVYLETTISAVQNAVDAQSENIGFEVGQYSQTVMDLATDALNAAQNVLDTATRQAQLDQALATLENEMTKFVPNLNSTTTLRTLIDSAQAVVDAQSGNIGDEEGQFSQATVDAAGAAISSAENVRDTASFQSSVDAAVTSLRSEMAKFLPNTRAEPDVTALQNAINDAKTKTDAATVGNGAGEYSQEVMDIAVNAITDAQNVRDTATMQSVVDEAVLTLNAEMAKFVPNVTGIHNANYTDLEIYPNPVRDELFINVNAPVSYRISDSSGRVLLNERTSANSIDVSVLQDGIYFIQVVLENHSVVIKRFLKWSQ
ncbi:MAG: T9SS type A sorting domain-containing protein, partial [Bacteroidales bacterium]|nr:T9SS type A sorting domain-containing protein [Bacteroidales bacterium]